MTKMSVSSIVTNTALFLSNLAALVGFTRMEIFFGTEFRVYAMSIHQTICLALYDVMPCDHYFNIDIYILCSPLSRQRKHPLSTFVESFRRSCHFQPFLSLLKKIAIYIRFPPKHSFNHWLDMLLHVPRIQ